MPSAGRARAGLTVYLPMGDVAMSYMLGGITENQNSDFVMTHGKAPSALIHNYARILMFDDPAEQ
jgi:hypothetical protein